MTATAPEASPIVEEVVGIIEKGTDLELRVRTLTADGEDFFDIREFVPSSETYGRGVVVPLAQKKALLNVLRAL